jgi:hypothetical protein
MDVLDQRGHQLAQARIGRLRECVDHVLRELFLVVLGHLALLPVLQWRRPEDRQALRIPKMANAHC